jgi:hypothetical protein
VSNTRNSRGFFVILASTKEKLTKFSACSKVTDAVSIHQSRAETVAATILFTRLLEKVSRSFLSDMRK